MAKYNIIWESNSMFSIKQITIKTAIIDVVYGFRLMILCM